MTFKDPVKVTGLREFSAGLKTVDGELAKELRKGLNEVAQFVVDDVRRQVPTRTGKARSSVRAASTQRAAVIKLGGRKAPYYGWLEFGGRVGRGKSLKRRFIAEGRWLYPTIRRKRETLLETLDDVLVRLFDKAGWKHG